MTSDESYELFWKIPDFLKRKEKVNEIIVSPEFTIIDGHDKLAKVALLLYPKGVNNSGYVDVRLSNFRSTEICVIACRFCILSTENRIEHESSLTSTFQFFQFHRLISIADLEKKESTLLPDGALTFVLKFNKPGRLLMK